MTSNKVYIEDNIGFVSLVDRSREDIPLKVVNAARISYNKKTDKYSDKDKKLAMYLYEHQHTSVYRHSWYTFHIKAPLITFRQWLKYQVASYWRTFELNGQDYQIRLDEIENIFDHENGCSWNEVSLRYTAIEPEFYFPKLPRANPAHGNKQASAPLLIEGDTWLQTMREASQASYRAYKSLLDQGIAKELARMTLCQNIYSEAYWTVSLQSVIHFLQQRLTADSQHEIRMYAYAILDLVKDDLDRLGIKLQ